MAFETSHYFSGIFIIESLRPGDLKSGTDLYDAVVWPSSRRDPNLHAELISPINKSEFFDSLDQVRRKCETDHVGPYLHLETHGDHSGIQLTSGESIEWRELAGHLEALNRGCYFNLMVVMAACDGIHLQKVLTPLDRAPVWGIIGPRTQVSAGVVAAGFQRFYDELLTSSDTQSALNRLNETDDIRSWTFSFLNAEIIFRRVFGEYFRRGCTDAEIERRTSEIVGRLRLMPNWDPQQEDRIRQEIEAEMRHPDRYFADRKDHFFMLDLYPENRARFPLTLEDCLPKHGRAT